MNNNFYITGGTLPAEAGSYIVRRADTELLNGLRNGEFCYVLNTRQMGKSSLMARTAAQLRQDGCTVVLLDLTAIGQNLSVEQWYAGLLGRMALQTGQKDDLFEFWRANREIGPMQRFLETIRGVLLAPVSGEQPAVDKLIIFVDEIDAVRSLPFSADEFFAGIRECYNRRADDTAFTRLTFCLLGVATPSDLIQDTRISPFNIGRRIELKDFTLDESEPLAAGLNHANALSFVKRIFHWTNGHPYLTQRVCMAVAEMLFTGRQGDKEAGRPGGARSVLTPNTEHLTPSAISNTEHRTPNSLVDALVERLFLSKAAQETDDNLTFVRSRILRSESDVTTLLDMYLRVRTGKRVRDDETNQMCGVLRLSGITAAERGFLRTRNRVYEQVFNRAWVMENLPNSEVIRQRRAYRLGVMRTAGLATVVLGIVSGLAVNSKLLANRAHRLELAAVADKNLARRQVYAANMVQLQAAYNSQDYGRARNLLRDTASFPSRGFEWRYWNRILHNELTTIDTPGPLSLMAWSRDGKWVVTQPQSSLVTPHIDLWDPAAGAHLRTLHGRTDRLRGVLSPVSRNLVALIDAPIQAAGVVTLWNPETGASLGALPEPALQATLAADGLHVLTIQRRAKRLESKTGDFSLKCWNAASKTLAYEIAVPGRPSFGVEANNGSVQSTADGRLILCGGYNNVDSPLMLLEAATGRLLWAPPNKCMLQGLSPAGHYLATVEDMEPRFCRIRLWDVVSHREITLEGAAPEQTYPVDDLAFSPDEKTLACTGGLRGVPGNIWTWSVPYGRRGMRAFKHAFEGHRAEVYYPRYAPDGSYLLTTGLDQSLRQWDMKTGRQIGIYPYNIMSCAISPDGSRFLTADSNSVLVCSATAKRPVECRGYKGRDLCSFTPDSQNIMFCTVDHTNKKLMSPYGFGVQNTISGDEKRYPMVQTNYWDFSEAAFRYNDTGQQIAISLLKPANGIAAELRDRLTGKRLATLSAPNALSMVIVADDQSVATASTSAGDGAKLWRRDGDKYKEVFRLPVAGEKVQFLRFLNGGRILICCVEGSDAVAWDTHTYRQMYRFRVGAQTSASDFAEAPDGTVFAVNNITTFSSTSLDLYNCRTGAKLLQRDNIVGVAVNITISNDSKHLVYGDFQQNGHILDLVTLKDLPNALYTGGYTDAASWSADGQRVVTGTLNGTCKLWDAITGAELMTLDAPQRGDIKEVRFSPDGNTIVAVYLHSSGFFSNCIWSATRP